MKNKRIGEILVDNKAITQENLDRGLSEQKELNDNTRIGPILLRLNFDI